MIRTLVLSVEIIYIYHLWSVWSVKKTIAKIIYIIAVEKVSNLLWELPLEKERKTSKLFKTYSDTWFFLLNFSFLYDCSKIFYSFEMLKTWVLLMMEISEC